MFAAHNTKVRSTNVGCQHNIDQTGRVAIQSTLLLNPEHYETHKLDKSVA